MPTFKEVQQNLSLPEHGAEPDPGLIVMKLDANGGNYGRYKQIVVVFNATNAQVNFTDPQLQGLRLHLHPVQQQSSDAVVRQSSFNAKSGTASVPALTTAVFVGESR